MKPTEKPSHLSMSTTVPGLGPNTPCMEMKIPMGDSYAYLKLPDHRILTLEQAEFISDFLDMAQKQMRMQVSLNQAKAKAALEPLDLDNKSGIDGSDRLILETIAQVEGVTRLRIVSATGILYSELIGRLARLLSDGYLTIELPPGAIEGDEKYFLKEIANASDISASQTIE